MIASGRSLSGAWRGLLGAVWERSHTFTPTPTRKGSSSNRTYLHPGGAPLNPGGPSATRPHYHPCRTDYTTCAERCRTTLPVRRLGPILLLEQPLPILLIGLHHRLWHQMASVSCLIRLLDGFMPPCCLVNKIHGFALYNRQVNGLLMLLLLAGWVAIWLPLFTKIARWQTRHYWRASVNMAVGLRPDEVVGRERGRCGAARPPRG